MPRLRGEKHFQISRDSGLFETRSRIRDTRDEIVVCARLGEGREKGLGVCARRMEGVLIRIFYEKGSLFFLKLF